MNEEFYGVQRSILNDRDLLAKISAEHEARQKANGADRHAVIAEGEVIAALEQFICRYLVLPALSALPLACWIAATYFYISFDSFPYLAVTSPVKRCGKTRLAEVLGLLALNPVLTAGISEAALFRLVDRGNISLLLDEAEALKDKKNERSQAIVSILNSGYRQGAAVYRCVPPKHELQPFSVYGPKTIIAIGALPDTVFDRSIVIRMRRKKAGEVTGRFLSRRAKVESEPLRAVLGTIRKSHAKAIAELYEVLPTMPELSDRDEELWQPLFAVCSVLAPERIGELLAAAVALSKGKADADADDSLPLKLLSDISGILERFEDHIPSAELLAGLKGIEESPWSEPGRELTQARLARMLGPFGVSSRTVRTGGKTPRGYLKTELLEAVALYIGFESATSATEQ